MSDVKPVGSNKAAYKRRQLPAQAGQALTEFLVVALALIPLFLLIPMIAKYQDIGHSTQMASRYAAFEATIRNDAHGAYKTDAKLAEEVRRRYFSNPDAPIKTNDVAGDFKAQQNLFWRDPTDKPLIKNFSDITVASSFSNASDEDIFNLAPPLNPAASKKMGLQTQHIYKTNISVPLIKLPAGIKSYEPFDTVTFTVSRQTSILVDPWTSSGTQQTIDRFSPVAVVYRELAPLEPMVAFLMPALDPLGSPSPKLGQLDFWKDVVPVDRLKPRP